MVGMPTGFDGGMGGGYGGMYGGVQQQPGNSSFGRGAETGFNGGVTRRERVGVKIRVGLG